MQGLSTKFGVVTCGTCETCKRAREVDEEDTLLPQHHLNVGADSPRSRKRGPSHFSSSSMKRKRVWPIGDDLSTSSSSEEEDILPTYYEGLIGGHDEEHRYVFCDFNSDEEQPDHVEEELHSSPRRLFLYDDEDSDVEENLLLEEEDVN